MTSFQNGYNFIVNNSGAVASSLQGAQYVNNIVSEISNFEKNMNSHMGSGRHIATLKGFIAEEWHSGTHNIDAAVKGSSIRTEVLKSNGYGSVDIASSDGEIYGLKYYSSGEASAKQQAKSLFETYMESKKDVSFKDFLNTRGISENDVLKFDPVYQGQIRVIPSDQLKEAIRFLEEKIAKEQIARPEQVHRYQETLNLLTDKVKTSGGAQSISLSEEEARKIAQQAKDGVFSTEEHGLITEKLVTTDYIIDQALKAGASAAIITAVLKVAPEIYKAINILIESGSVDKEQFKKIGFSALEGSTEGFLRGSIAASMVISCHAGHFGTAFKSVDPTLIGMATVIVLDTIKNSFLVASGTVTKQEMAEHLIQSLYVSASAFAFGSAAQSIFINIPVLAYMLGSFVGSVVGSFTYTLSRETYLSIAIQDGCTFFGLVDQDYVLPEDILKEIGLAVLEYQKFSPTEFQHSKFKSLEFTQSTFEYETIGFIFLRRGIIGVNKIGYVS